MMNPTPSQTIGPFFRFGFEWLADAQVVPWGSPSSHKLFGRVTDGAGEPVPDAVIEVFVHPPVGGGGATNLASGGFARALTEDDGSYVLSVIKSEPTENSSAHLWISIFARGLLQRLVTRCYFSDEDNSTDAVLQMVDPKRRATLISVAEGEDYRFDIRLQGDQETVFFSW